MKKKLKTFLVALLVLPCIFAFSACDLFNFGGTSNTPKNVSSLSVVLNENEEVYSTDDVLAIKDKITVTATYNDDSSEEINDYYVNIDTDTKSFTVSVGKITSDPFNMTAVESKGQVISENIKYEIFSNKTATVVGIEDEDSNITTANIKEIVNGKDGESYNVTSIGNSAFSGCESLTSIIIGNNVTRIGYEAFANCSGLTEITIPDSVTMIDMEAFSMCGNLGTIKVDSKNKVFRSKGMVKGTQTECNAIITKKQITMIVPTMLVDGNETFEVEPNTLIIGCKDTTIPNDVTSIGMGAFAYCSGLTEITIPDSVTSIGYGAFANCSGLTNITIGKNVTSIGQGAFESTGWYTNQPDGVIYIGKIAYKYKGEMPTDGKITLKDDTVGVAGFAFSGFKGLKNITIGNKVTSIGMGAFMGCGLTEIIIPSSVTMIDVLAFSMCSDLGTIKVDDNNEVYTSKGMRNGTDCNAIIAKKQVTMTYLTMMGLMLGDDNKTFVVEPNTLVIGCKTTSIPNDVKSIGYGAFANCDLTAITIPDNVTSIGDGAFSGCEKLTSVTISKNVTSIGYGAFSGCGLTEITIPSKVARIDMEAFSMCSNLGTIKVDDNNKVYTSKGMVNGTQQDCNAIMTKQQVTMANPMLADGNGTFEVDPDTLIIGCKNTKIPDDVTSIGNGAFYGCKGLTSINIPNSVISIGNEAFRSCSDLTSVTIGNGVTSIGDEAFYYCNGLTSINIPDNVTSIGDEAFYYCNGLTSINIPDNVTSIGDEAFYDCSGLTSVTIGNGVTSIGDKAFIYCSGLTAITIPDSVTSIGDEAFGSCYYLTSVTIGNGVESIGAEAFSGCSDLTTVTIGNGVTSIGDGAFMGCGLTEITIPDSVTSIGDGSFRSCYNLTSVTIGNGVTSIGDKAFIYCSGLTEITIPDSVTSIGDEAFRSCSDLTSVTIGKGVTSIGDETFRSCSDLTSVTIDSATIAKNYEPECYLLGDNISTIIYIKCDITKISTEITDKFVLQEETTPSKKGYNKYVYNNNQ